MSGGVEPYLVAGALGFVIGFERERRALADDAQPGAIGTRTFTLIGLAGALCAANSTTVVAVGLLALGALVAVSYWRTSDVHRGTTTELTALVVFLLGAHCQRSPAVAAGIAVVVALLLEQKSRLRRVVRDVVTDIEVDDMLRYFAMALVVWPLLPNHTIDRWGIVNPSHLWRLVVIVAGVGWLGYVGTRVFGPKRGLVMSGVAGGFVSASATTAVMARTARLTPTMFQPALAAALGASVSTCVEMEIIVVFTDARVAAMLALPLLAAGAVLAAEVWLLTRHAADEPPAGTGLPSTPHGQPHRPLQLGASMAIAVVITATLVVAKLASDHFGSGAAVGTAAVAGLADAHGAALGMVSLVTTGVLTRMSAALAVAAALGANTAVKVGLAFIAGGRRFGTRFALGIAPAMVVALLGLVSMRWWW